MHVSRGTCILSTAPLLTCSTTSFFPPTIPYYYLLTLECHPSYLTGEPVSHCPCPSDIVEGLYAISVIPDPPHHTEISGDRAGLRAVTLCDAHGWDCEVRRSQLNFSLQSNLNHSLSHRQNPASFTRRFNNLVPVRMSQTNSMMLQCF